MKGPCLCNYERCIAPGVGAAYQCGCVCHSDFERGIMQNTAWRREDERCTACKMNPVACARGIDECSCHNDRPSPPRYADPVVAPGHDFMGHEQAWARHPRPLRSVSPDIGRLLDLREQYLGETHPEYTVGGAS